MVAGSTKKNSHEATEFRVYDEDDFKAIKRLGYGDMGTVFLAIERETDHPFAIKVMDKEVVRARKNVYRADRELEILTVLDNPFVPRLLTHFESKKNLFLVTDYCPGGDMNTLRHIQSEKRFSENAARFYAAEVLLALEYLHSIGVIYRDLKPENVLIQENGHIMLTDFDLSLKLEQKHIHRRGKFIKSASCKPQQQQTSKPRRSPFMCANPMSVEVVNCSARRSVDVKNTVQQRKTTKKIFPTEKPAEVRSQSFVGTEEYVAPEMILGSGHGMALDWWTFGVFLYEMVHGVTPFKGRTRRDTFYNILNTRPAFNGDWSPVSDLISKLLVRDPSKRLGLSEIKSHVFFRGIDWELIHYVSRPPWVPPPLAVSEFESELVIDELLKQTAPAPSPRKPEPVVMTDDDGRTSTASSTISDQFSDAHFASF